MKIIMKYLNEKAVEEYSINEYFMKNQISLKFLD